MKTFCLLLGFLALSNIAFGQSKNGIKMDQKIAFITLGVMDLKTSIDFYENKFGWKRSEMSNDDLILYQLNSFNFALYPKDELAKDANTNPEGAGFKAVTFAYLVWSEKEVDDLINSLREKDVKIIKEPQKVFWGGYSSYISDPDGNLWEIAFNPFITKDSE